jgi:hypothetical protein
MYTVDKKEKCKFCNNGVIEQTNPDRYYNCEECCTISYPCPNKCIQGFTYTEVPLEDALVEILKQRSVVRCMIP